MCSIFFFFVWGYGGTTGFGRVCLFTCEMCLCWWSTAPLGPMPGRLAYGGGWGGKQGYGYKARPLTSHWSSPECRRAWGTSLPLEGAAKSLLYTLGCSSHPPYSPEWCHQSTALSGLGLHPCPYQLLSRAGVSQQVGLEQSLHLSLNLFLFLLMWRLFLGIKEWSMKNILSSSHTVLKFNFLFKDSYFCTLEFSMLF